VVLNYHRTPSSNLEPAEQLVRHEARARHTGHRNPIRARQRSRFCGGQLSSPFAHSRKRNAAATTTQGNRERFRTSFRASLRAGAGGHRSRTRSAPRARPVPPRLPRLGRSGRRVRRRWESARFTVQARPQRSWWVWTSIVQAPAARRPGPC